MDTEGIARATDPNHVQHAFDQMLALVLGPVREEDIAFLEHLINQVTGGTNVDLADLLTHVIVREAAAVVAAPTVPLEVRTQLQESLKKYQDQAQAACTASDDESVDDASTTVVDVMLQMT